jgi:hypothetical protein
MANTLLNISMITLEALRLIENNLTFTKGVMREYDDSFGQSGAKIGDTLNIRKPARYIGRTGAALSTEDLTETSIPLQLNVQRGVDVVFTSKELTLNIDQFKGRVLAPAVANIANGIDRDGITMAELATYNLVGTPGTVPNALLTYLQAGAKLDYMGCPRDGQRSVVIDPLQQATIVDALKGLFQSSDQIKDQYESGNMGRTAGFKWSMDQNIVAQTVGPLGGTPAVNGASQTGSSLVTNGWTAAAAARLNAGDVFTIAGVFSVNPQSRASTGQLQQFVVTAAVSSDASGNATIPISPAITPSGQFQNVTASPASGALLTVVGTAGTSYVQGLAYHKEAFTFACADLQMPKGVDMAARMSDPKLGMSLRLVRAYNINNDTFPCRFDILYGWKALYPEWSCRITS